MPDLPLWEWLALATTAIAALSSIWSEFRRIIGYFIGVIIVTHQVSEDTMDLIIDLLKDGRKVLPAKWFFHKNMFVRSLGKQQKVMLCSLSVNSGLYFYKKWPLWYSPQTEGSGSDNRATISFFRWTVDWKQLTWEASQLEKQEKTGYKFHKLFGSIRRHGGNNSHDNFDSDAPALASSKSTRASAGDMYTYLPLHFDVDDLGPSREQSSLEQLSLSPELQDLVEEFRFWRRSEDWYRERNIPWRRSYGYTGKPGSGKSSLVRGLAEDQDMAVLVFDLATMTNQDFSRHWNNISNHAPCIALFEDLDGVFGIGDESRINITKNPDGLDFSCFINHLDGVDRMEGVCVIITSNHLDKMDEALLRPGRMDRIVTFQSLDFEGRYKLGLRILQDADKARELAEQYKDDSAAMFQERCFKIAIADKYAQRYNTGN